MQKETDHLWIGFDAREWWLGQTNSRGEAWKEEWFVRMDVEKPLSIERAAWSSVFDLYPGHEPPYKGLTGDLWASLEEMEGALPHAEIAGKPFVIMAFSVILREARPEEREHCDIWTTYVTPNRLDPGWKFLGYEVADWSPFSVLLTTCTAEDLDDRDAYRQRWGPHLNRWHLFKEFEPALAMKNYYNEVYTEHAPFLVYGHWLVRGVHGGGPPSALPEGSGR